jgi:NH3-dependent NAD+ synthetase
VCPACDYFHSLRDVDWDERWNSLQGIVTFGKKHNQSGYDCIIGVSGGKDSTRQAVFVREVLGMKCIFERSGMHLEATRQAQEIFHDQPTDLLYYARFRDA